METISAYQVAPECTDSGWDSFVDDEGKFWTVVDCGGRTNMHSRKDYSGASPEYKLVAEAFDTIGWGQDTLDHYALTPLIKTAKERGVAIGARLRHELQRLALEYWEEYESKRQAIVARALSLLMHEPYVVREIRGSCQGEYAEVVMPASCAQSTLDEIEARYFNTGTEWRVNVGNECFSVYTWAWRNDEQERQMREQAAGFLGTADIAIEVYEFSGYTKIPNYARRVA